MIKEVLDELLGSYGELKRWLTREMGNAEDAADLAQTSFERVWAHAGPGAIRPPRALLFHTGRNLRIDSSRRAALVRRELPPENPFDEGVNTAFAITHTPEHDAVNREMLEQISMVVDGLPLRCRGAFVLNSIHGLNYDEVAKELNISKSAVEKHVMRGLDACRMLLQR